MSSYEALRQGLNELEAAQLAAITAWQTKVTDLEAELAACQGEPGTDPAPDPTPDPPPVTGVNDYYRDFTKNQSLASPWHVLDGKDTSKNNVDFTKDGARLWVRNGTGAGIMLTHPIKYGLWEVRMRISGVKNPTTKVCLLLWQNGGGWPPEIDFNESGDRTKSNQTLHYGKVVNGKHPMEHSSYNVDQNAWHTYGVRVTPTKVEYLLDGNVKTSVENKAPGIAWNVHIRTTINSSPEQTSMDVATVKETAAN